ncbi:bifunctional hydroxymethylpyrimidine kinase/phosphomethylpyrimidine kinase [Paracoccus sp. YIM 132242]|uniref:hydroxymethylpyrimidine kinase n=1 Tax=Paracoccus lichenicola TaxID=2665644 RepID=A0A6L6HS57_9RHOB|nr:bifunctional hydroxymethylpyrimidine kinase/phosphomethylpyrimidine kinase [Paracoccus lichenicola]MTE01152.1 bifunctional hydroxymethylpyrimidine kinase/phosphomethylpyrimidine kinase [Paracoccus lichenicola]
MTRTVLTIAGSDSGGGAGIQADLKTVSALGCYGASAITAVTAQNTRGVLAVHMLPPDLIRAQIDAVLDDIAVHAIKIGMVGSSAAIAAVAASLRDCPVPVVLDPVMVAKSGDVLMGDDAIPALLGDLLPLARVLTPNLPEAARLLGVSPAGTEAAALAQGQALRALGPGHVLMKGGHAAGAHCTDLLAGPDGTARFSSPRIRTRNTHGTGCALSAAIAAGLAQGLAVADAVGRAHDWLHGAILAADDLAVGGGNGPVHHFHALWPRRAGAAA